MRFWHPVWYFGRTLIVATIPIAAFYLMLHLAWAYVPGVAQ